MFLECWLKIGFLLICIWGFGILLSRLFGILSYLCKNLNMNARREQPSIYQSSPLFCTISCLFIGNMFLKRI